MYSRKSHDSCCQSIFHAGQVDIKCFIWVENRKFTKFQMKLLKVLFYQIADWKEVFMLFDRDEDGVLSFQELQVVMKSMGQRPSGWWAEWRTSDKSSCVSWYRGGSAGEGAGGVRGLRVRHRGVQWVPAADVQTAGDGLHQTRSHGILQVTEAFSTRCLILSQPMYIAIAVSCYSLFNYGPLLSILNLIFQWKI